MRSGFVYWLQGIEYRVPNAGTCGHSAALYPVLGTLYPVPTHAIRAFLRVLCATVV